MDSHNIGKSKIHEVLKVAVVQMTSVDHFETNFLTVMRACERAVNSGAVDLILFPENSLFFRIRSEQKDFHLNSMSDLVRTKFEELSQFCKHKEVAVHLGSFPRIDESTGKKSNQSLWFSQTGRLHYVYEKVHLFDVDVPGAPPVRESLVFDGGDELSIGTYKGWKIGFSICYDIRFAELYSRYASEECDLILIPSAFIVPTGKAHWEILNRARAIESQCYVISSAQGGTHRSYDSDEDFRKTYGHSIVVDPWGDVLSELKENTLESSAKNGAAGLNIENESESGSNFKNFHEQDFSLTIGEIKLSEIAKVRERIPMANHRKLKTPHSKVKHIDLDS